MTASGIGRHRPVHGSVIAGESQRQQRRDLDLAGARDRALDDRPGGDDRHLRRIEHGDELLDSERAEIGDGEGTALEILLSPRVVSCPRSALPVPRAGVGLLASTQFQFQDVGVILELTPHLLADGEVAIHASIEISSLGANVTCRGGDRAHFWRAKDRARHSPEGG